MNEGDLRAFLAGAAAAVEQIAGRESEFYRQVPKLAQPYDNLVALPQVVAGALGTVRALRDAVSGGHLAGMEARIRANVEDDFLEQATALLESGYHVAAMVLAGGVMEDHLRAACAVRSLSWNGAGSLSKYNAALYKADAFDKPTMHLIDSLTALRNSAAHGGEQAAMLKVEDVADAIKRIRRLLADVS
jgi:hypothetical protein